jgi:hypothetical protein
VSKQGKLPDTVAIENDTNVVLQEQIFGRIVYTNFSTPRRVNCREVNLKGALAISSERIVTTRSAYGMVQFHIKYDDNRISQVEFNATLDLQKWSILRITSPAQLFHPEYRGEIKVEWRIVHAKELCERIQKSIEKARGTANIAE